ncbi:MAG: hypothetical protein IT292_00880 [Deltaproteobacteria bacterium]|nr:hypothetical protein [Deltaproteobacteria bacterium]
MLFRVLLIASNAHAQDWGQPGNYNEYWNSVKYGFPDEAARQEDMKFYRKYAWFNPADMMAETDTTFGQLDTTTNVVKTYYSNYGYYLAPFATDIFLRTMLDPRISTDPSQIEPIARLHVNGWIDPVKAAANDPANRCKDNVLLAIPRDMSKGTTVTSNTQMSLAISTAAPTTIKEECYTNPCSPATQDCAKRKVGAAANFDLRGLNVVASVETPTTFAAAKYFRSGSFMSRLKAELWFGSFYSVMIPRQEFATWRSTWRQKYADTSYDLGGTIPFYRNFS